MELKDKITIILSICALLFGSGFIFTLWDRATLKNKLELTNLKRTLDGFLLPLQFHLDQNKRIHSDITAVINLKELEYAPDYIKQRIHKTFPAEDARKFWFSRIETITENNNKAIELFESNMGFLSDPADDDLRDALTDFVSHAQAFCDIWRKIEYEASAPTGRNPDTDLYSEKYPSQLDTALKEKINRTRQLINP